MKYLSIAIYILLLIGCSDEPLRYDTIYDAIKAGDVQDMERHLKTTPIETNAADGSTPLTVAVLASCIPCIEELLDRGADPKIMYDGKTLLHLAVLKQDTSVAKILLNLIPVDEPDQDNYSSLMLIVSSNDLPVAEFLLEHGADPNYHNDTFSVLGMIGDASTSLIQLLLDYGADIHEQFVWPPLFAAAANGNLAAAQFLIEKGVDINCRMIEEDLLTSSALHQAAIQEQREMIKFLLDSGIDTSLTYHGYTAAELIEFRSPYIAELIRTYHPNTDTDTNS